MNRPPRVSILVLSRDRLAYTRQCLQSLEGTAGADLDVVVVENGSRDGSREFLAGWAEQPGRRLIENAQDVGSARGRNQALAAATGEYVCFLDNDVHADQPEWLEQLLQPLLADPDVVATSPLLLFPGSSGLVQCAGGGVTRQGWIGQLGRGCDTAGYPGATREEAWAPAAALLARRAAVLAVGGFDEAFDPVALLEDVDLCYRLRHRGGRILHVGSARLRHYEGTTYQHLGHDLRRYYRRHERVIRRRWADVIATGPFSTPDEVRWKLLVKDYSDPEHPVVRFATRREADEADRSYLTSSPTLPARAPALRVGVAGCGQAALRGALPGFSPPGSSHARSAAGFLAFDGAEDARIVGVADVVATRAQQAGARFGVRHVHTDVRQLIELVPIDALVICTPPWEHVRQAAAALRAGLDVLVEKPAAASAAELDELLALREEWPTQACVVNLPWAYHPALSQLRALVAAGELGDVTGLHAVFEHSGPEAWAPDAGWYRTPSAGGVAADLGGHLLTSAALVLGGPVTQLDPQVVRQDRATAIGRCAGIPLEVSVGWDAPASNFTIRVEGTAGVAEAQLCDRQPPPHGCTRAGTVRVHVAGQASSLRRVVAEARAPGPALEGPYRSLVRAHRTGGRACCDLSSVAGSLRHALRWAEAGGGVRQTPASSSPSVPP